MGIRLCGSGCGKTDVIDRLRRLLFLNNKTVYIGNLIEHVTWRLCLDRDTNALYAPQNESDHSPLFSARPVAVSQCRRGVEVVCIRLNRGG